MTMASNYPTSIDSFTDPLSNSPLNNPSHAAQHQDVNDAVEKLETKLGVGSSPASGAASGHVLVANGSGSTTWQAPAVTAAQFANVGLVYITHASATSGTSLTVNNCFSSTYVNYLLHVSGRPSGGAYGVDLRLRASGTDTTTGYYWGVTGVDVAAGTALTQRGNNGNVFALYMIADTQRAQSLIHISSPQLAQYTGMNAQSTDSRAGASYVGIVAGGQLANTTQYDGFTLLFGGGGGTISYLDVIVYGYKKA